MIFYFKKIVAPFFFPLPLVIFILSLGLCLLWRTDRQKAGKVLVTTALMFLLMFSYDFLPGAFLRHLERSVPTYDEVMEGAALKRPVKYIVVLGGGHTYDGDFPVTSRVSSSSMVRLVEGIRIQRLNGGSKLVLSGGGRAPGDTDAGTMGDVAISVGVAPDDLIIEERSKDTKDQAVMIKSIVRDAPFVLVTSASHMPRALALFEKQGMRPIPAPADHDVRDGLARQPGDYFPDSGGIEKTERVVHEYLGTVWASMRGQI